MMKAKSHMQPHKSNKSTYMNGRALDFELWDSTLVDAKIFEGKDPANWIITEGNYKAILAALEINDDSEINAEVRVRLNKSAEITY